MDVCVHTSEIPWETLRQSIHWQGGWNEFQTVITLNHIEPQIRKTQGMFLYLTRRQADYLPVAAAGMSRMPTEYTDDNLFVHFFYVLQPFRDQRQTLFLTLLDQIAWRAVRLECSSIHLPCPHCSGFGRYRKFLERIGQPHGDQSGLPFTWYGLHPTVLQDRISRSV